MGYKRMRGLLRMMAAVILAIFLLPAMLRVYLALSASASASEAWVAFVQAVPFGDQIATVVLAIWAEARSGVDSLVSWLAERKLTFPQHFTVETGKLVFTSILLLLLTEVIGTRILKSPGPTVYDRAAEVIFQTLCCFGASLIADLVYGFFDAQLLRSSELVQNIAVHLFTLATGGGGIYALLIAGIIFGDAMLMVVVGCMKLILSYGFFLLLLLCEINGGQMWFQIGAVVCWFVLIAVLLRLEEMIRPAGKRR